MAETPSALEPRVDQIIRRLDELRKTPETTAIGVDPALLIPAQNPTVISVLGDQGVGKSTTLKYVCDQIRRSPRRLITPVVSPERFAEGDTLFGWVLSAITELLPEELPELAATKAPEYRERLTIIELADLLRRQEALARKRHQTSSVIRSAHPDEWAESISAITTAGMQLVKGWAALLNGLSPEVDQIIIPIDDADQVPSLLGGILRDLRWLTVHPLVAVVVCANEEMLLQSLFGEPELAVMEAPSRRRHSVGVLAKALPRHLRVSISSLQPQERLSFVPQGESESLIEVLKRCELQDPGPFEPNSLGDLFQLGLGSDTMTSPYAELLPATPRQLDHLWRELRDIRDRRDGSPDRAAAAARHLIQSAIETSIDASPDLPHNTIRFFETDAQGLSVEFDFSKIEPGMTVGAGRTVHRSNSHRVSMRRIDGFPLHPAASSDDGESVPRVDLPSPFSMAHYFAWDLTDPAGSSHPPFFLWGYVDTLSLPGGPSWEGSLDVDYNHKPTDNLFALVPDWEARYDYFLYTAGWNAIWNLVKDIGPDPSPALLEWLLVKHLTLVVEVQSKRAISPDFIGSLRGQLGNLDGGWSPQPELEKFAESLDSLYRLPPNRTIREADFATWLEVYFPPCADDVLGIPEFGSQILDIRQQVLKRYETLERANGQCARFLAARVRRHVAADWITHTINLIRKFEKNLAGQLEGLHEVAREESDSELQAIAATLEHRNVPSSVIGELFLSGVTPELERELRLAGLPSAAIHTLAERFAPPGGVGSQVGPSPRVQGPDPDRA